MQLMLMASYNFSTIAEDVSLTYLADSSPKQGLLEDDPVAVVVGQRASSPPTSEYGNTRNGRAPVPSENANRTL